MHTESSPSRLSVVVAALALAIGATIALPPAAAFAKGKPAAATAAPPADETTPEATADKKGKKPKGDKGKSEKNGSAKPEQLGAYGDWGAYVAQGGKDKTCYALGQPKERQPKAKLKDTSAYIFISTRPGEGVRNEVAINLGYATKDGSAATADIDGNGYELITKGTNAWIKDQTKEREFVGAMRGGSKLVVKASSAKGTSTTDLYSLKGLSDALAQVAQECK